MLEIGNCHWKLHNVKCDVCLMENFWACSLENGKSFIFGPKKLWSESFYSKKIPRFLWFRGKENADEFSACLTGKSGPIQRHPVSERYLVATGCWRRSFVPTKQKQLTTAWDWITRRDNECGVGRHWGIKAPPSSVANFREMRGLDLEWKELQRSRHTLYPAVVIPARNKRAIEKLGKGSEEHEAVNEA